MPSPFEMQPSAYHLGLCNVLVPGADGVLVECGRPAVERRIAGSASDLQGDERRCLEHAESGSPSAPDDRPR